MTTPASAQQSAHADLDRVALPSAPVTEADWLHAQTRVKRLKYLTMAVAAVVMPSITVPAMLLGSATASGRGRYLTTLGWAFILLLPLIYLILRISLAQQAKTDRMVGTLTHRLSDAVDTADVAATHQQAQAQRQRFERRLVNALDMVEGEAEVIDVIERSFASIIPATPVELLLADNSHAHLMRVAQASPTGVPPGCGVESPDHCPAARRAQVQHFEHSEELDACPKLRGRGPEAVSSLCVPVSIMGRTVGVIHATGEAHVPFEEDEVRDLGSLANFAGARIGLLRVMAETQLQAETDSLTGTLNRRAFERRVSAVRREIPDLTVAMSDLDHFKGLNDTYGHDAGDRALRLFAEVLRDSVRAQDLVCRHGGGEFVIALPGCPAESAREVFDTLRAGLDAAIAVAGLPSFTVSFGVVDARIPEDLQTLLKRADAALLEAKREGRNRVVVHDLAGTTVAAGGEGQARYARTPAG